MLCGVLWNVATHSTPETTFTASEDHMVDACTGLPDQLLHELQWQYAMATGSPETSI
jgi:hypothetical protein